MNVLLLAAGEGTRLRPYTFLRPKPAIPFLNIPLAAYPLAFLEDLRIDRLIVNTFHLPTKVVDLFVHLPHQARHLHFSHEIEKILGNGGGLGYARDYFQGQGDLMLLNSDEVIIPMQKQQMEKAMAFHKSTGAFCTLITMDHPGVGTQFGGVWLDDSERVQGFGLAPPNARCEKGEHFIGVQILSEEIFKYLPNGEVSNILYDAVAKAIADGKRVQRYKIDCHWYETGNPKDFMNATAACLDLLGKPDGGYSQEYLKATIHRFSREMPVLEKTTSLTLLKHSTAKIVESSVLTGFAVLGPYSLVNEACVLKNVVVANGAEVQPDTHAENEIFLEP